MLLADLQWGDGSEVVASPRQILRRQLARLAERGLVANAGTELEFIVFKDTYEEAWKKAYRDLEPANLYNIDYSLLGLGAGRAADPPDPQRDGRGGDDGRELQGRVQPRPARDQLPLRRGARPPPTSTSSTRTAPRRSPPRRRWRSPSWRSSTEAEGNSCHIHCSLAKDDGGNAFAADRQLFERFVAGQLACLEELTLLYAPHVNSYKRFAPGSFAPTAVAWGNDNRTCSMRVVGHGEALRFENRLPGADVNPYLALAAMIAAGLHGVDSELELEAPMEGNAYTADKPHVPTNMYAARDLFAASEVAREAFGSEVIDHYLNRARVELEALESTVTDWELFRGFERL